MTEKEKYEKELAEVTYPIAEKIYKSYYSSMKELNIDKDDWLQDAVMYIVLDYGKYNRKGIDRKYLKGNEIEVKKDIYGMLNTWFRRNYFQTAYKNRKVKKDKETIKKEKDSKKQIRQGKEDAIVYADRPLDNENDISMLDLMQDTYNYNPSQLEEILEGKEIFEDFINYFDKEPYKTFKHEYKAKSKLLPKNAPLSEYNIAKLIINGETLESILKIYNVYTSNIGSSSTATFVNRKVKEVINMLSDAINSLPEYERKIVKAYINSIQ